ncbi:MAG: DUF2497 domain-containing protein [Lactobacillales bacterium]|jgi:cell pole-organizing protein PopZ|nr:DUF2497 domain-containing protein [Lactobacillales bacterium]
MQDQPEELSVDEILSSIRDILSKELSEDFAADKKKKSKPATTEKSVSIESPKIPVISTDVFVLTPQMLVFKPGDTSKESAKQKIQNILSKLSNKSSAGKKMTREELEPEIRGALKEWLNSHLPQIIEKTVDQEVKNLISKLD